MFQAMLSLTSGTVATRCVHLARSLLKASQRWSMTDPIYLDTCYWTQGGVVHGDDCTCPESPWCPSGNHLLKDGGCTECSTPPGNMVF